MDLPRGLRTVDRAVVHEVAGFARRADLPVYVLETGGRVGREAFFDAVRAALPLDPPVRSSHSWDALSDSLWQGLWSLDATQIVILWPDATAFRSSAGPDYEMAVAVLDTVAKELTDTRLTVGRPKHVSILVGLATA